MISDILISNVLLVIPALLILIVIGVLFGPLSIIIYTLYFKKINIILRIVFFLFIIYQLSCLVYLFNIKPYESPFYENFAGITNLHQSLDISRLLTLIKKGADVNAQDKVWGNTPLHVQIIYNNQISQILIDNGADINIQNYEGKTPIHLLLEHLDNCFCDKDIITSNPNELELYINERLRLIASNQFNMNLRDKYDISIFDLIVDSNAIKHCPKAIHVVTIIDKSLVIQRLVYNSSGELIFCENLTGKLLNSKKEPRELSKEQTQFNTIVDLHHEINQNNYHIIDYKLKGFEPLPKSEPIYKNPKDRPKPFWVDNFFNNFLTR